MQRTQGLAIRIFDSIEKKRNAPCGASDQRCYLWWCLSATKI